MPTRLLTIADLPALDDLGSLSDSEGFRFVRRFIDDITNGRARLDSPCEFFLANTIDERLVGFGGVTTDPYVEDPRVGRLRHLYIRPEVRGTGIGRALVAQLEGRAEGCYTQLRLRTDTLAAARFYERLGYEAIASDSATHQRVLPPPSM
ncbi:MAG: GNAT family N-acetyltransferase [bacterium]